MSKGDWDANKAANELAFQMGVAETAGVDAGQVEILSVSAGRRRSRALLSGNIVVEFAIYTADQAGAEEIAAGIAEDGAAGALTKNIQKAAKEVMGDDAPLASASATVEETADVEAEPGFELEGGEGDTTGPAAVVAASVSGVIALAALLQ